VTVVPPEIATRSFTVGTWPWDHVAGSENDPLRTDATVGFVHRLGMPLASCASETPGAAARTLNDMKKICAAVCVRRGKVVSVCDCFMPHPGEPRVWGQAECQQADADFVRKLAEL
jgi:hypothetical protein